jgi:hypothetical protein
MNTTPCPPDESPSAVEAGIRRSLQIGDVHLSGLVTGGMADIHLQLESPFRVKVSSPHIPGFSLMVRQWMRGTELTPYGEEEVSRLFGIALALAQAVQANRAQLLEAFAGWEREVPVLQQLIVEARKNLARVNRERRDAARDGRAHEPAWQNAVLKPAKARVAQSEARVEKAMEEFEARLAELLGFDEQLPGCASFQTIRELLDQPEAVR